ncbi:MAG: ABC transporter ATP-binding protein [Firmicutes bacterium]|nr:ABC transporter ATP-binding protein [Bacillota bacterium]
MSSDAVVLEAIDVHKAFGGVQAVNGTSLRAARGRITGLIGPNGAGKSTMIGLLSGALQPDRGTVRLLGQDVTHLPNWRRARLGLIRTFQVSREFGRMTVLENLMVAQTPQRGESFVLAAFAPRLWKEEEAARLEQARAILDRFQLSHLEDEYAANLSGGQKRLLEMARALMANPKILLLDEPMAGVNPTLAQELAGHIESLRDEGMTILLIEHELRLVERLCDPVVVMAQGRVLAEGTMDELRRNEEVVKAYLVG